MSLTADQEDRVSFIKEVLANLDDLTPESRSEAAKNCTLQIAALPKLDRAVWLKEVAKKTKIPLKTLESEVLEHEKKLEETIETPQGEIDELFESAELLAHILQDIDADHKLDKYEKACCFLVALTGELPNPSDRKSAAIKGDSSSGKDNLINSVLKRFPQETNKFLTHTTSAALRKSLDKARRLAFSEINAHRENGANSAIVEEFKQLAEGGISAEICDKNTGEVITLSSEQKTLLYGTTDLAIDEELHTRYVVIPLRTSKEKNSLVVNSTLSKASKPRQNYNDSENWISRSIRLLNHDLDVIIPFAEKLSNIKLDNGEQIFDYRKPRIMRDVKRLLSLTKAVTWLYQKQREVQEHDGKKYLVSEPADFIAAYEITEQFFRLTYLGLDHRSEECYEKILSLEGQHTKKILEAGYGVDFSGWVLRDELMVELGLSSLNGIKRRLSPLKDMQLIEDYYDHSIQKVILRGCQKGITVLSRDITRHPSDTLMMGLMTPYNSENQEKKEGENLRRAVVWEFEGLKKSSVCVNQKNDTLSVTPFLHTDTHTFSEEVLE